MDKIDTKITLLLIENSRESTATIAKKARISQDKARFRIQRLKQNGIIRDFTTTINTEKLEYISALIFLSINAKREKEFKEYINNLDYTSWAGTHLGFWSIGFAIYGKNITDIEEKFQEIFSKFKEDITNHKFEIYKEIKFYPEKYLSNKIKQEKRKNIIEYKIDKYDKIILSKLAKNSRISAVEISKEINISAVSIANRISKLEKSNYIKGYSVYLNMFKLNLNLFIFFIQNKKLDERKKLHTYLESHPNVSMILNYVGDPFIEFSLFSKNPYEIREMIQEIKEKFPENKLVDFFMSQEDFISFGAPKCVFE